MDEASIKEMILEAASKIDDSKERFLFKDLMEGVFLSLFEANQAEYAALEGRVLKRLSYDVNHYLIKTGLMESKYLDSSHHLFSPMAADDMEDRVYNLPLLEEQLQRGEQPYLMRVFLCCDYLEIRKMLAEDMVFKGFLKTNRQEYEIEVVLERSQVYIDMLHKLYRVFIKNGIPWLTINAPYLQKMADVRLKKGPGEFGTDEEIKEITIDFKEYGKVVKYGLIPVWNVGMTTMGSTGFPVPCDDHKHFEHSISLPDDGVPQAYLVGDEEGIQYIRRENGRLVIVGRMEEARKWNVYIINGGPVKKIDRFLYPLMDNQRRDGFTERFQRINGQMVKTEAELTRYIEGLGLADYLEFVSYQLLDSGEGEPGETYSLNDFIKDELHFADYQKRLLLTFRAKDAEGFLNRDLASYIVSEVQFLYPEYLVRAD